MIVAMSNKLTQIASATAELLETGWMAGEGGLSFTAMEFKHPI
jgi:hypothetical protein